jgi:two-component system chemotaxis response regulator CheB
VSASDAQAIEAGKVYVARSDLHLTISPDRRFSYRDGTRIKHLRSSANPLFESAAAAFKDRLVAIVLTGHGSDATDGVQTVKAHGGIVIAQDPACAEAKSMPQAAVRSGAVDRVLPLEVIGKTVDAIVRGQHPAASHTN